MKRVYLPLVFILFVCISFCAHRKQDVQTYTTAEVNLSARCSMYREALNRRLDSLEKNLNVATSKSQKVTPAGFSHENFGVE